MQLFTCPFCGPRGESEFHFGGDAGNIRPEGDVSAEVWTDYLYFKNNSRGAARQIWMHLACREVFLMERDTVTHEVISSEALVQEQQA
ncbi:sarcosine oxidase subunit delta [Xinfangfangia sp. CPCC 101601]|uniref:Sarcosine oxidase subunit delta n=1 Tax=Pseudogemmobacter lacusdianii TaxID=3069608 RepID=A0ABU0W1R5_9RHOB|nr:sarcosine oxidase subunit delta [Xinfangfangia sp. CPCC 101601]MDQ2067911.1 sarcosine oxidase subunit delta [Xinfangfangia sp. CPCC 101601]